MYYRIDNEPQIDSEIIEPISQEETPQLEQQTFHKSLIIRKSPNNKFPLWLLLVFLVFLGIIGILFFLKINNKYSTSSLRGSKIQNFGYNFY